VLKTIFTAIFQGWSSAHPQDIRDLGGRVVSATTETFNRVRDTMRPTPSKSHYTFNLRDVSKVFQGVLMIGVKELGGSPDLLARLWCHECMRVFHDRLTDAADKNTFTALMEELLKRTFGKSGAAWSHAELFEQRSILFVDCLRAALEEERGKKKAARLMIEQLQLIVNERDAQVAGLRAQVRIARPALQLQHRKRECRQYAPQTTPVETTFERTAG
jgi:dynein heavy chain